MTRHRTTNALLVVVAVLLGLNLTLRLSPPEAAGQEFDTGQEFDILADGFHPRVIQVSPSAAFAWPVFRLWSDGVIEWAIFADISNCEVGTNGHPWRVIPEEPLPLPPSIRVVEIFAAAGSNGPFQIIRVLSDGTVQRNVQTTIADELVWCG